jgi:hypothetical protein
MNTKSDDKIGRKILEDVKMDEYNYGSVWNIVVVVISYKNEDRMSC